MELVRSDETVWVKIELIDLNGRIMEMCVSFPPLQYSDPMESKRRRRFLLLERKKYRTKSNQRRIWQTKNKTKRNKNRKKQRKKKRKSRKSYRWSLAINSSVRASFFSVSPCRRRPYLAAWNHHHLLIIQYIHVCVCVCVYTCIKMYTFIHSTLDPLFSLGHQLFILSTVFVRLE